MKRPRLLSTLIAFWLIILLYCYHAVVEPFPAWSMIDLLVQVALLGLVTAAAWGYGAAVLSRAGLQVRGPGGAAVLRAAEIGAGLGSLALAVFLLSIVGLLYRPAIVALLGAGLVMLALPRIRGGRSAHDAAGDASWSPLQTGLLAVLGLAGLATLAAALAPPEFYDALIYHLAVPDQYIRHHRMVPIEGNYYAHFPANMGMLYAAGLLLRGGELAQSIHWLCGALSVLALFAAAVRHADRTTALLACVLFASTPGVMLVSTYAIADLGITFFATLCFVSILEVWNGGGRRWVSAAGLFAGLAAGTKYTAIPVTWLPAALALLARPGAPIRTKVRDVALFSCVAAALLSPWLARNAAFTGNPVAPYFQSADGAGTPGVLDEMQRRQPKEAGPAGLALHVLAGPWNATMKRLGAGGYLTPVFLALLPALPFVGSLPGVAAPAALMAGAGTLAWAASSQVTRYLMPILPLAALLAALAARRLSRWIAVPAVAWPVAYGLYLYLSLIMTIGSLRPVAGIETRDEYLARRVSYYQAAVYLGSLPAPARVLMVGEGRGFHMPVAYVASTPFDPPALDRLAARAGGGETELRALLRDEGFTHLLLSEPELRRTRQLTAAEVMSRYFPSGDLPIVFEQQGVKVYALAR